MADRTSRKCSSHHKAVSERYADSETTFVTETGAATLIDFMWRRDGVSDLVRIVRGVRGTVAMHTELTVRFEHGSVMPWVTRKDDGKTRIHSRARQANVGCDGTSARRRLPYRG